jgi:hypothetical protein
VYSLRSRSSHWQSRHQRIAGSVHDQAEDVADPVIESCDPEILLIHRRPALFFCGVGDLQHDFEERHPKRFGQFQISRREMCGFSANDLPALLEACPQRQA